MTRNTPNAARIEWLTRFPDAADPIKGDPPLIVITENSQWVITADAYLRAPRGHTRQRPVRNTAAVEGRLDDDQWHRHRGAYWSPQNGWIRLRVRPVAGPPDGYGIVTGAVIAAGELFTGQHHRGARHVPPRQPMRRQARLRCDTPSVR